MVFRKTTDHNYSYTYNTSNSLATILQHPGNHLVSGNYKSDAYEKMRMRGR